MRKVTKNGGKIIMSLCETVLGILLFINPLEFTEKQIRRQKNV